MSILDSQTDARRIADRNSFAKKEMIDDKRTEESLSILRKSYATDLKKLRISKKSLNLIIVIFCFLIAEK